MAFQEGPSKESIKPHLNDSHSKSNADLSNQIWEKSTLLTQCNDDVWERFITQFSIKVSSVFPPDRAITGIPLWNQRWPPENWEMGQTLIQA